MGRSRETFGKKEVRKKKEKKRKEKEEKRQAKREEDKSSSLDDMIAYVDKEGNITDTPPDPEEEEEIKLEDIETSVPKTDPSDLPDPIRQGKVSYFNDSKGFGFIEDAETRERVFVHINNAYEDIQELDKVSFEVEQGHKGPVAVNVQRIE